MTRLGLVLIAFGLTAAMADTGLLAKEKDKGKAMRGSTMGEMMLEDMKAELGLDDAQVSKLRDLRIVHREARKDLENRLAADVELLRKLVKRGANDEDLKAGVEASRADHRALVGALQAQHDEMQSVLTAMQQAKMVVSMDDRWHRIHQIGQKSKRTESGWEGK
jgi:Spy/CpxP family protein refolding chaperone